MNFAPTPANQIVLRYLRVASAGCSIPKSGESCWSKLRLQTGLTHSPMPKCTDYEGTQAGVAASVIAYPVEATLYPKPSVRSTRRTQSDAIPKSDFVFRRASPDQMPRYSREVGFSATTTCRKVALLASGLLMSSYATSSKM